MARQLPSHLSYLLYRLNETGRSFIELYGCKEKRMQAIVGKLREISKEVNELQHTPKDVMISAVFGGLAIVVLSVFLLSQRLLAGEGAATMAILGFTVAFGGGAAIVKGSVMVALTEKIRITTVEQLIKELLTLVELQKDVLEEINMVSEALEEKSSSLMTTTGAQAKITLSKTKQLQQFLRQVSELAERSNEVMDQTMERGMRELLNSIFNINPTPGKDAELRYCISSSAIQCMLTVNEFVKMRDTLKDFEEMQTESECAG